MSETATQTPVNLDINDLVNVVKIIDFCFEQGTFKGVDSTRGVLQVRDRLAVFLDSLPKTEDAVPASEPATTQQNVVAQKAPAKKKK